MNNLTHWINKHPFDWAGHAVFFGIVACVMSPLWAVCALAVLLEVDQWLTWRGRGWSAKDTIIDLIADAIGIIIAITI